LGVLKHPQIFAFVAIGLNMKSYILPFFYYSAKPVMEERTDLCTLLQQQQGVLMHILNNEADMEEKYAQLKSKLKI